MNPKGFEPRLCLSCGQELIQDSATCVRCGDDQSLDDDDRRDGILFLLLELERILDAGDISAEVYERLRRRYREEARALASVWEASPNLYGAKSGLRPKGLGWTFWTGVLLFLIGIILLATLQDSGGGIFALITSAFPLLWGFLTKEDLIRKTPKAAVKPPPTEMPRSVARPAARPPALTAAAPPAPAVPAGRPPATGPRRSGLTTERAPVSTRPQTPAAPSHRPAPAPRKPAAEPVSRQASIWLAEQQANLLLYLGAFLVVVAALIFVSSSRGRIGPAVNMSVLALGTLAFMAAGAYFRRRPRVREAGVVFFAVSALMVPLNFVGAYAFFFADGDLDPAFLWLGGSIASALFYTAVSFLGMGRWYAVPAGTGIASAVLAALVLTHAAFEVRPAVLVLTGLALVSPRLINLGRTREVLGSTWWWIGHAVVLVALPAGLRYSSAVEDLNWPVLLLLMSLAGVAFLGVVAFVLRDTWHAGPAVGAVFASVNAAAATANGPVDAYIVANAAASFFVGLPLLGRFGRLTYVFGPACFWNANGVLLVVSVSAIALVDETDARWYLPLTGALVAAFYWLQALRERYVRASLEGHPHESGALSAARDALGTTATLRGLVVSGAAAVSLVFATHLGEEWYGVFLAAIAGTYMLGILPIAPRWQGTPFLGWLALLAATAAWLPLEGTYNASPAAGAAVHVVAALLYLAIGRISEAHPEALPAFWAADRRETLRFTSLALFWASTPAILVGFLRFLQATHVIDTRDAGEMAWAYCGLSLALLAAAATMAFWWRSLRWHVYALAAIVNVAVFVAVADRAGQAAAILTVYAVASLLLCAWERRPWLLVAPAAYGAFAVLVGWRYLEPKDAYAPLAVMAAGLTLILASGVVRARAGAWAAASGGIGLALVVLAPIAAGVRLVVLYDAARLLKESYPRDPTLLLQVGLGSSVFLAAGGSLAAGMRRGALVLAAASSLLAVDVSYWISLPSTGRLPDYGAGVHLASFAAFLTAARLIDFGAVDLENLHEKFGLKREVFHLWVIAALVLAAGVALNGAFFHLLKATALANTNDIVEVAWSYFGLSLAVMLAGAAMSVLWRALRWPVYGVAVVMSAAVAVAVADRQGIVTPILIAYGGAALATCAWERKAWLLVAPASFAFLAVFAGWHYLDAKDAYAPPAIVAAAALGGLGIARALRVRAASWAAASAAIFTGWIALAPVAGWVRLAVLSDPATWLRDSYLRDPTLVIQMALGGAIAAIAGVGLTWGIRRFEVLLAAAALLTVGGLLSFTSLGRTYERLPDQAAAMHLAALAFFIVVARTIEQADASRSTVSHWWKAGLTYAAGAAFVAAGVYLLSAVSVIATSVRSDVSWAMFGLSVVEAAIAISSRFWWRSMRRHIFFVAIATSVGALAFSADLAGQAALVAALYAALAMAVTLWEREPAGLSLPALYGFIALMAAWRHYAIDDWLMVLVFAAIAVAVLGSYALLRRRMPPAWMLALQVITLAYAVTAPVFGAVRLINLADEFGIIGNQYLVRTGLFQTTVAALFILSFLIASQAAMSRNALFAIGASVVMMAAFLLEIAHFRPENPQAYSLPLGLYLLSAVMLASRYEKLPEEVSPWLERLYGLGPTLIMAPAFVQSFDTHGWGYGVALLAEALIFLAIAILERRIWLLTISVTFVVTNAVHFLLFTPGGQGLPSWAILAVSGTLVMASGTALLLGRDRWPEIQRRLLSWWQRTEQQAAGAEA